MLSSLPGPDESSSLNNICVGSAPTVGRGSAWPGDNCDAIDSNTMRMANWWPIETPHVPADDVEVIVTLLFCFYQLQSGETILLVRLPQNKSHVCVCVRQSLFSKLAHEQLNRVNPASPRLRKKVSYYTFHSGKQSCQSKNMRNVFYFLFFLFPFQVSSTFAVHRFHLQVLRISKSHVAFATGSGSHFA